jgi:hypothetical protein
MTFDTSLPSNVGQGDEISVGGDTYYIRTKDSATEVTVHSASANTHSNAAFTIQRAYNDAQSWETARGGDLVGESRRATGRLRRASTFVTTRPTPRTT